MAYNNRAVADSRGEIIQKTHYYPFGMAFADSKGEHEQRFKYNGKELDRALQLNTYDYAARYMDPAIGRFTSIDPHAENYYSWSPYAYVGNNPMRLTDPTGMDWFVNGENGNVYFIRDLTNLRDLTDDQAKFLGIDQGNLSHYENLGGDDLISPDGDPFYYIGGDNSESFMSKNGFTPADRVRAEEITTERAIPEGLSRNVASSDISGKETGRYRSYVREGQLQKEDLGNGSQKLNYGMSPDMYKGKEISRENATSLLDFGQLKTRRVIDYKVPVGEYYYPTITEKQNYSKNAIKGGLSIYKYGVRKVINKKK